MYCTAATSRVRVRIELLQWLERVNQLIQRPPTAATLALEPLFGHPVVDPPPPALRT